MSEMMDESCEDENAEAAPPLLDSELTPRDPEDVMEPASSSLVDSEPLKEGEPEGENESCSPNKEDFELDKEESYNTSELELRDNAEVEDIEMTQNIPDEIAQDIPETEGEEAVLSGNESCVEEQANLDVHSTEEGADENNLEQMAEEEEYEESENLVVEESEGVEDSDQLFLDETEDTFEKNVHEEIEMKPSSCEDSIIDPLEAEKNGTAEPLPECRNKRSYVCGFCNLKTSNPREYLYHLKDTHGDNIKIFECSLCTYASKTHQKLVRHNHMVHKITLNPEFSEQKKKNKEKAFKPSTTKKIKHSPINRSPRESKSPRRFEEYEFMDDSELDCEDDFVSTKTAGKQLYHCDQCSFTTFSTKVLGKHENKFHLKRKFFKCSRCNYATQVKARYTKHVKYHQLPIIKCDWCDFRTPYRWNLDRHTKNHTEEMGEHRCHLCNFTAQIKQSLTVHVANHHLTPEQIKEKEAKRMIGISDPEDYIADEEMELLRMERDEDPDALELPPDPSLMTSNQSFTVSNIDMGTHDDIESPLNGTEEDVGQDEPKRKKPKIKIILKKMKPPKDTYFQELNERHNFDEDFIHPDDVVHRHGNVYIKTEKCSLCPYKAPFLHEIERHKRKIHGIHTLKLSEGPKKFKVHSAADKQEGSESSSDSTSENSNRKYSQNSNYTDSSFCSTRENSKNYSGSLNHNEESMDEENSKSEECSSKDSAPTKKKSSFFDKLQEKLSSSNVQNLVCQFCGHESKCLSESVRHQKLHLSAKHIYTTPSLSTRCQFCRHRCKTTDDLMNHLKSCSEARKNQISDNMNVEDTIDERPKLPKRKENRDSTEIVSDEDRNSSEPENKHPMENKVFVWNNISNFNEEEGENAENISEENTENLSEENTGEEGSRTPSEGAFSTHELETLDEQLAEVKEAPKTVKKRVYQCPECDFWSTPASRFHVHIVGHYNTKPYRCSECGYRSNWRWDITKHIKLKLSRGKNHRDAQVCLADDSGENNYEKYDKYLSEIKVDEMHANRTEGGLSSSRRGRPKRVLENDSNETDSAKSSPCPTPLTIPSVPTSSTTPSTGPSTSKIPAPPRLMRAPNRQFASSPGPNPFGPINPGVQMMVEMGNANHPESDAAKKKFPMRPPPLVAMRTIAQHPQHLSPAKEEEASRSSPHAEGEGSGDPQTSASSNYQIITPQGALHTSLETLQLLASGSTNLAKLKRQQKEAGEGKNPELDAAVANQDSEAEAPSSDPPVSNIMQLVLDHEGNPEWKCLTCDFRDNEQETVVQHVRLAHSKKGPVSLLHAVHRCSVCGFAAGTKRHVQVHLETAHNGQGGIISRSEGQNIDPESGNDESNRSFDCRLCPFTCKKRGELKSHLSHHTPRVDYVFKCMFCPYYVATKSDLFNHLSVHSRELPAAAKEAVNASLSQASAPSGGNSMEDANARHFVCDLCPFDTRSRAKLMHHRQFHRPRGLPFSCPHCSYNVTRRHLLAQHLRIHGVSPTEGLDAANAAAETSGNKSALSKLFAEEASFSSRSSKSPSPSLTITPISGAGASATPVETASPAPASSSSSPPIDAACLPTLSDELTRNLHDIPLVWVSRDARFYKMFKCRHCPHVNLRKSNIQEHEKMHRPDGLVPGTGHACQFCSYMCINAGVMSAHLKVHSGSMGKCHAIVDQALPNEQQLHMLAGTNLKKAFSQRVIKGDEKLLYYCQNCPSRFFLEKEVHIHSRFHISNANFTHHCSKCNFGARDESQILAHAKVHTPEYQERTRTLMSMHPPAPSFPPVHGLSVPHDANKPTYGAPFSGNDNSSASSSNAQVNGFSRPWLSSSNPNQHTNQSGGGSLPQPPPTSRYKCDQCPSTFSKLITLQYHQSLHSADNPFRCTRCTYAAKTQDGLQQHLSLHEQADLEKSTTSSFHSSTPTPNPSPVPSPLGSAPKSILEETLGSLSAPKPKKGLMEAMQEPLEHPPIKLKFIGLKGASSSGSSKKQFKYYIEEQVPLSGVELLKRKNQIEREMPKECPKAKKGEGGGSSSEGKSSSRPPKQEDKTGNPSLYYPLHIDKSSGRSREKRYKCNRCPSAFEKLDQFNVHINLHGSNYKYKCKLCDYSVKFYANFMMHIKRHKYHEKMEAQKRGLPLPLEDQMKYEPQIGENSSVEDSRERDEMIGVDKENHFDFDSYPDMTTAEKQQIILQHKKADAFQPKVEDKDKRVFYCQYCPYANMRRDAVDSHSLRHQANLGRGVYQCNFCDYTASQPNFIREHTKVHFRPFKYVLPEGYMRHDKMEIWSIKTGELMEDDDTPKKTMVFGHEDGAFTPSFRNVNNNNNVSKESLPTGEAGDDADSQLENGILVDFRSGDIVEAPSDFIIPLRPAKTKVIAALGNGSSGKHKNSKWLKARKKPKLEPAPAVLPPPENKEEEEKGPVSDGGEAPRAEEASSSREESAFEADSSPVNGDLSNENSRDPEYSAIESTSLKENLMTASALSH